ncbi:MAG: radical SAM protein, partial [Deltaproteobacteria bacterium]|nr:radical SAM protein [Deltaproteobacteria bacterium]
MRSMRSFEQGPIRPPSEASSLLVRVSRNCPWNRCAFCPVYKGQRFSLRSAEEVLADLDAMREALGAGPVPRTAFLQDANPLLTRPDDLVRIVEGIRERFPEVERITAYARAHTLVHRGAGDLRRIREAGLDRLHVGLESGCDEVLALISKGATRGQQIEAGQRAKQAGFELSEYVMPGLGGSRLSAAHADDTASALVAIQPDFVRLRTTSAVPGTELA